MDCPSDCPHLVAARRYEREHRRPIPVEEFPYPQVEFPSDLVHEYRPVVSGLGYVILKLAAENRALADADAFAALRALAETYRTLSGGIYYERPPDFPLAHALYTRLAEFLQEFKRKENEQSGFARPKDTEAFHLLVFLLRVWRLESNGRPRSRAFLDFLRAQYPHANEAQPDAQPFASLRPGRIIAP